MNDAEAQYGVYSLVKIVISAEEWLGLSLSNEAWDYIGLNKSDYMGDRSLSAEFRSNPKLVECIEVLGERANVQQGAGTRSKVIEIPDDVEVWHIAQYEGREFVCEGEPIHFSHNTEENRFVIELDGQILRSRQIWSLDDGEYGSGYIKQ